MDCLRGYKVKRICGTWVVETPASVGTFNSLNEAIAAIAAAEARKKKGGAK